MADRFTYDAVFDSLVEAMEDAWSKKNVRRMCGLLRKSQDKICRKYEAVRKTAKEKYMDRSCGLLDRHKCAAAFMIAFLTKIPADDAGWMRHGLVREKLAIIAGLTVLATFVTEDGSTDENKKFIKYLENNNGFKFPEKLCDTKPYSENWAIELFHAQAEKKIFLPSLAHELFYVERYNRMACALGEKKMKALRW